MSQQREPGTTPQFVLKHRLALSLEEAGLKPEDMATHLGKSVTTIRNYLAGRTVPDRAKLIAWSLICGVRFGWLANGIEAGPDDGPGLDLRTPPGTRTQNLRDSGGRLRLVRGDAPTPRVPAIPSRRAA